MGQHPMLWLCECWSCVSTRRILQEITIAAAGSELAAARAEADAWRETAHLLVSRLMDLGTRP